MMTPLIRLRGARVSALCMALVLLAGCRSESERLAMGQVSVADHARAPVAARIASPGSEPTLRRVWSGPRLDDSAVSPDGRWVTVTDWSTGDLAVYDLTTDGQDRLRPRHLTDKGSWQGSADYALGSVFSPEGDRVAYSWFHGKQARHELRILDFGVDGAGEPRGSSPRVAFGRPDLDVYSVLDWSSDDRVLILLRRPDRSTALALVSALDGGVEVLESFGWREPNAVRSPEGQFIAYDVPPGDDDPQRDIFLLSTDGERKSVLVDGPEHEIVLGWSPAGDRILFATPGPEGSKIWELPVPDGIPSGPPRLLEEVAGWVAPIGWAGDAFYIGIRIEHNGFQVADLDLDEGRILGPPTPIRLPLGGSHRGWDWSPDGRHYAVGIQPERQGGFLFVIGRLDGTALTSFHTEGRINGVNRLRWSPDGESIYVYAYDRTGHPGIQALELASGEVQTVRRFQREAGAMGGSFALSPDGARLYFRLLDPGAGMACPTQGTIMVHDLATGEERPLHGVRSGGSLALSPDGAELAFVDCDPGSEEPLVLKVIPANGGEAREVFRDRREARISRITWTPDGRGILFLGQPDPGEQAFDLRAVPAAGGEVETLAGVPPLSFDDPRLHVDGRIAFRAGEDRDEIWVLEGVAGTTARHAGGNR